MDERQQLTEDVERAIQIGGCLTEYPRGEMLIIRVKRTAKRFIMRRKSDHTEVTLPPFVSVNEAVDAIVNLSERVNESPRVQFHPDQLLEFPDFSVILAVHNSRVEGDRVFVKSSATKFVVSFPENTDFTSAFTSNHINSILKRLAHRLAPAFVMPRAAEIAERLGCRPRGWKVSSGYRTLGHCSRDGVISLSSGLMFLPYELRDYIICHELAHLTEFNHSEAFHNICNGYLNGREAELIEKMHRFRWPFAI